MHNPWRFCQQIHEKKFIWEKNPKKLPLPYKAGRDERESCDNEIMIFYLSKVFQYYKCQGID
jgi:hypothetical protein